MRATLECWRRCRATRISWSKNIRTVWRLRGKMKFSGWRAPPVIVPSHNFCRVNVSKQPVTHGERCLLALDRSQNKRVEARECGTKGLKSLFMQLFLRGVVTEVTLIDLQRILKALCVVKQSNSKKNYVFSATLSLIIMMSVTEQCFWGNYRPFILTSERKYWRLLSLNLLRRYSLLLFQTREQPLDS